MVIVLTFTEWYEKTYEEKWHEDYAGLYRFVNHMSVKYEKYCEDKGIRPVWDG